MAKRQPAPRRPRPTDAMVAALLQHGRRIEVEYAEADRYEQLARAATRFKKVPDGTRVRVERRWQEGKAWVILEELPAWMTENLPPIPVALALRDPSDVIVQLRDGEDLGIARGQLNRALRLLDALVREARRRGYEVSATVSPSKSIWSGYDRQDGGPGHLVIALGPDRYRLSLTQERAPGSGCRSLLSRLDQPLTPHLRLTIEGHEAPFWRRFWSDVQGPPLEESLAKILQELELRHERAGQGRRDAKRQQHERQRRWEAARARAIGRLIEAHRAEILEEQIENWELADRVRAYLAAAEARLAEATDAATRAETGAWLRWVSEYAERIDPLNAQLRMPDDPRPTPEALAPFMKGWDPHGPH